MNFGIFVPIVAILASAWVIVTLVQANQRKGDRQALTTERAGTEDNARLAAENARLNQTVERLEERLAVLERIATDPAERTAREIENLR